MRQQETTVQPRVDTSNVEVDITDEVFYEAECVADAWKNTSGNRLYRLIERSGDHPAVFAFSEYTREIDGGAGEVIESETITNIGEICFTLDIRSVGRVADELSTGTSLVPPDIEAEVIVEEFIHSFTPYVENRIPELIEDEPMLEFKLGKEILVPMNTTEEVNNLYNRSSNSISEAEWEAFFWALSKHTNLVRGLNVHEFENADKAYAFIPNVEPVPEWRVRAAENHLCGAFRNTPALANVAALMDVANTQVEIADELNRHESTISQQVSEVNDILERAEWMCKNRVH
jgi:hypothetical protein